MSSKRKAVDAEHTGESRPSTQATGKRQRVSRACDQCRIAREKCDGVQPQCFPCVSQARHCTYQVNPKKRGVQTGYIRTLELALAWVFEKVPGCEDSLNSLLSHEAGRGQVMLSGKNLSATNRLHKRWRRSKVHQVIEGILSGDVPSQPPADKDSPSDEASDTDGETEKEASLPAIKPGNADDSLDFSPPSPGNISNSPLIQVSNPSQNSDLVASRTSPMRPISAGLSHAPPGTSSRYAQQLKLPSNHWRLLDIYFSYTHCWLPILKRQEIFQTSYLYPSVGALAIDPNSAASAAHAELWSALALASFQDATSSKLSPSPNEPGQSELLSPTQIYDIARRLIPSEEGPFHVHHARALLLLSLINIGRENLRSAWILVGLAIRIFLDVGIHDWSVLGQLEQQFRSVFIACFVLDTILSERLDRPPHLRVEDMIHAHPVSENDLDEWQPWMPCEAFGQSASISRQSRSPAYCMSTFNQLYGIMKSVSRDLMTRHGKRDASQKTSQMPYLHQAISSRAPFGAFVLSPEPSSATIPSPYLVRVLFLWAGMVLDEDTPSIHLTMDVLEQYQHQFGMCAAPPFFAPCLSSLANHRNFNTLSEAERMRFASLRNSFLSVWSYRDGGDGDGDGDGNRDSQDRGYSLSHLPHPAPYPHSDSHQAVRPPAGASAYLSAPTPPSFYSNTAAVPVQQLASAAHAYPPLGTPYAFPTPQGGKPLLSPATTAPTHESVNNDVDGSALTSISAVGQSHRQQQISIRPGFAGPSLDYDTLLDDLASIDYVDRVDTDPHFMVNLGFAPGCGDLAEILSRDFGTL